MADLGRGGKQSASINRATMLGSFEKFLAAFCLTVCWIFDLHPTQATIIGDVLAGFPFRNDAFQIKLAGLRE